MERTKIERISELARKQRSEGLSDEEKAEQKRLREEYLSAVRENFKKTLDNIEIIDKPIS